MQHEDAFVYLSAIQGEQCLSGRVPALCQGRFCAVEALGTGSEEQESHGQAEGLASPALPVCGFVLFIKPGATCGLHAEFLKLETSSPSNSYSPELVTIPVPGLCHRLGPQFSTAWAQPQHPRRGLFS